MKVKKKAPCRSVPVTAAKPPGVRRRPGRPRLQEKPWTGHYRKPTGLLSFSTTSERLRRATRKSSMLRGAVSKVSRESSISKNCIVNPSIYKYTVEQYSVPSRPWCNMPRRRQCLFDQTEQTNSALIACRVV